MRTEQGHVLHEAQHGEVLIIATGSLLCEGCNDGPGRGALRRGADCLYAPGLDSPEQIRAVTSSLDRPANVVMGLVRGSFSVEQLGDLGVRRISVGSAMARAAYGALLRAADEISTAGTFTFARDAVPYARLHAMLSPFDPVK